MSRPALIARRRTEANRAVFDGWTLVHVGWGGVAGAAGLNPWAFLAITGAYEVLEYIHEHPRGSAVFGSKGPESGANMVGDVGVAAVAFAVSRWAARR